MFGPLKRLFSKPASSPPPVAAAPVPVAQPVPMAPSAPVPAPTGDVIQVPLSEIMARLPATLTPLILSTASGTFALPAQTALTQLPTGAVRIPFAQLRRGAPPGTFAENPSLDNTLIDLPLPRILAGINPALLTRRPAQKQVEVPDEISGVFEAKDKPRIAPVAPKPIRQPVVAPAPVPTPIAPKPVAAPVPAAQKENALSVPLAAVCEFWPRPVREEIAQSNRNDAAVFLPMVRLDSSMKTGRVSFSWAEVAGWLNVTAPAAPSPHGETVLEFPLKVIAPLFMARRQASAGQKKITVGENIPDLFSGLAKPSAPPAPVAAPVAPAPVRDEWSPQEIIKKIDALPGVAGSVIVTSDGLLVAGNVPPPLKSETMAAFLPQLFGRVGQYAGEIHLEPVTSLTLFAGSARCAIFKTGTLYLAVLGGPGQTLPDALLQCLAAELAQRNP